MINRNDIKIYILEPKEFPSKAQEILESFAIIDKAKINQKRIGDISKYDCIIVRLKHYISKEIMQRSKKLKVIASPTTGLNHINLNAAKQLGIRVLTLKNEKKFLLRISATAEHTMALMLALLRKIPAASNSVNREEWNRDLFKGTSLNGKILGIIGYGRLGKMVANYAKSFGMKILCYDLSSNAKDANAKKVSLDTILKKSDIITVHLPYEDKTKNFFSAKIFNKMKQRAYFINTSRGEVIDEEALLAALKSNRIAGAALDVLSGEQKNNFPMGNKLIDYLKKNTNLIITPHIGGATAESMEMAEIHLSKKIKQYFSQLN